MVRERQEMLSYLSRIWVHLHNILRRMLHFARMFWNIAEAMQYTYIYNISWEDPAVDTRVYGIDRGARVCMITTGGDNVLDALIEDVATVLAVDINKHQNWLLELKCAAIASLEWEDCFRIFAKNDYNLFVAKFETHICPCLRTQEARMFWRKNMSIMKDFHNSGLVKYPVMLFRLLAWASGFNLFLQDVLTKQLNLQEQAALARSADYAPKIRKASWLLTLFCASFVMRLVGVPLKQWQLQDPKTRQQFFHDLLWYLCTQTSLVHDNYFYHGYFYGEWTEKCCPRYLKKEYYTIVKQRLGKVDIVTGLLHIALPQAALKPRPASPDDGACNELKFDLIILLDHMDWLNDEQIAEEVKVLRQYLRRPDERNAYGGKLCWRSFSTSQAFGVFECEDFHFHHSSVIDIQENNEYSDRVGMYKSIHVASIRNVPSMSRSIQPVTPQYNLCVRDFAYTLAQILTAPFTERRSSEMSFLNQFYAGQAKCYDAYRHFMLGAKQDLLPSVPLYKGDDVLLFAGGTGDVLDYIPEDERDHLGHVTVLDLCRPLLDQGRTSRATYFSRKSGKTIEFIHANALDWNASRKYDKVFVTYSFTMISDWRLAMEKAISHVKAGGYLCVADFTLDQDASRLYNWFWKTWFQFDHVFLDNAHYEYLENHDRLKKIFVRPFIKGGFPFIPQSLVHCTHYSALFRKTDEHSQ